MKINLPLAFVSTLWLLIAGVLIYSCLYLKTKYENKKTIILPEDVEFTQFEGENNPANIEFRNDTLFITRLILSK